MSGILWHRRPSAPDTVTVNIPPRARTTSGGGLAAISNVLGLSKAKSRERLRNNGTTSLPAKTSSNRQTVVSTGSSDMYEPTTPSSTSDQRSFQGANGVGIDDDPFARGPVFLKESPLAAFPEPPSTRPRTATPRNNSTLLADPGPSRHLQPPSPGSSVRLSSGGSSRSRSTSASSSVNAAKSPRTPPPISSVSPADMHAHADAVSWSPESIYEEIRPRQYNDDSRRAQEVQRDDAPIRRGASANAVLARVPSTPRLIHSASSSHLSSPTSPTLSSPTSLPSPSRAGPSSASGMGSMTAMASEFVKALDEPRAPPKRPSKSELRLKNKASTSSLSNQIVPPKRKASLLALQESHGLDKVPEQRASTSRSTAQLEASTSRLEPPASARSFDPRTRLPDVLEPPLPARSPESILQALDSFESTPPLRPRTSSTPSVASPRPRLAGTVSPRVGAASPWGGASSRSGATSPRSGTSRLPTSPRLNPSSPRAFPSSPPSEALEDLDNYQFTIAPAIQESDAQSISFSELGVRLIDDESGEDDVTFHHDPSYLGADSRYGRRPPPSPTGLPFMGRRRLRQDTVYPSGVHTIPISDQRALARIGREENLKEEDAVVGQAPVELDASASIEEEFPTPPASSPSPVNPLERMSTGSQTSSCSSIAPDAVPPQTISSQVVFSKHARTASYSDSEIDFEPASHAKRLSQRPSTSTQTAVAWRCGAGNHEKCCGTRAMQEGPNTGQYKCCAERTSSGKNARCCASFIGRPCERPRVSSTSSAELKRQRSLHFSSLPGIPAHAPVPGGKRSKGGFFRPHTSHGKSTSSALLDDETRAIIQSKTREDPGPQSPTVDVFATMTSPPTSPMSKHEFRAKPIISPAKLYDHLKETRASVSPAPTPDPLKSPRIEPTRARSNTTTTDSGSVSVGSVFSDAPAPLRPLLPPRRNPNTSLPSMSTSQPVQQPRRYVQSIASVGQPGGLTKPPRSPGAGFSSLSSGSSIASASGVSSMSGISSITSGSVFVPMTPGSAFAPITPGSGLPPPPPRRLATGRITNQPIVSFISSRSAPNPPSETTPAALRHRSSRESYESSRTVRRERSIPLRENQMSFLEFGVEEEEESEEEEYEPQPQPPRSRPTLQHIQSFLDLSGRQSGDTMRENNAMFS